jgi:hypothetical protein
VTNYSNNPGMVRVDFYKPGGKWYMTEAVDMSTHYMDQSIIQAVRESICESHERGEAWLDQFVALVAEPYHQNAYPIMLQPEWMYEVVQETETQRYFDEARERIMRSKGWMVNGEPEPGYDYHDLITGSGMFYDVARTPEGTPLPDDPFGAE